MRSLTAVHEVHSLPEGIPSHINQPGDNPDAEMAGAQDTIYLCNFRVSVDGEWLCLKELHDMEMQDSYIRPTEPGVITSPDDPMHSLMGNNYAVMFTSDYVIMSSNDNIAVFSL